MMQCVAAGHEIVALANLHPAKCDEMDSYMYQTVGHDGISMYSDAMGLPLYRREIKGEPLSRDKEYSPQDGDEVEDLYLLLSQIRVEIDFDAVAVGAILSDYQRVRVENVCSRLGCVSLAYLWRRSQPELLKEMIDCGINAIIIKTACLGLDPDTHLGQTITEIQEHLLKTKEKFAINVCGEGGEYETFTLDCPLFKQSIILDEYEKVIHSNDAFAPVGYLKLNRMHLVKKTVSHPKAEAESGGSDSEVNVSPSSQTQTQRDQLEGLPVKTPLDYLAELAECNKADCCDGRDEICNKSMSGDGGADSTAFSSNSSNCSGYGIGEFEQETGGAGKIENFIAALVDEDQVVKFNGNGMREDCSCQNKKETLPFPSSIRVIANDSGWCWVMGIRVTKPSNNDNDDENTLSEDIEGEDEHCQYMKQALLSLQNILKERGMNLSDLVAVVMFVGSMGDYAKYNSIYIKYFASQPPVRVCVEAPLPADTPLIIDALAYQSLAENEVHNTRQCMHVQGISHWAPANIGPYSQAVWVGDILYVAGQIGLVPGSMKLMEGGARMECKLALRHINRIIKAVDSKVELRDVVQGICYVTDPNFIVECREEWEKRTNNAVVEYLVVSRLPRDANVEWQVWAHKHNSAFEYKETGCYIGSGVKVRIIRRSSYENRVAVIVCRASICDQTGKIGTSELAEITEYAFNKLLQEAPEAAEAEKSLDCSAKIFYRIGAVNPADIYNVFENQATKYSVAYSILPVCSLVHENTVLSLCAVRHQ
jgi:diphthine-ammonia ligase